MTSYKSATLTGYNTEQNYLQQKEGGCQEEMISAMCINNVLVYHQMLLKIITIADKYFECTFSKQSSENWSVRMQWIKLIDFVGNIPEKWWWTLVHKAQCFIIFYSPTSFVAVASLEFYIFPPKAQFSKHGIKKAFILPCWKGLLCHVIALLCSTFIVLPLLISSLFTNKTRPLLHKKGFISFHMRSLILLEFIYKRCFVQ